MWGRRLSLCSPRLDELVVLLVLRLVDALCFQVAAECLGVLAGVGIAVGSCAAEVVECLLRLSGLEECDAEGVP